MKKLIAYLQPRRHLALAVAFVSASVLVVALIAQYGFDLKPCELCILERWPYAANIVLGLLAFGATFRYPRLVPLLLSLVATSFFINTVIAGYHVGVEQKWWEGPSACTGSFLSPNMSIAQLRELLTHKAVVRCDVAAWRLFGISMAGYDCITAFILGILTAYLLKKDHATQA